MAGAIFDRIPAIIRHIVLPPATQAANGIASVFRLRRPTFL